MILLISSLLFVSVSSLNLPFIPPEAILQAGYPSGFRAFIPDFPGCQKFAFGGRLSSPFHENEINTFSAEVLRPVGGFWSFENPGMVLTPGDILHYWTLIVKDKEPFPKYNLSWTVPEAGETVDLLKPITLKPPITAKPTKSKPAKMVDEPTTTKVEPTALPTKAAPTSTENDEGTSSTLSEEDKISTTVLSLDGKIHPSLLEDENSTPTDENGNETPTTSNDDTLSRSGTQDDATSVDPDSESTNSNEPSTTALTTSTPAKTTPQATTTTSTSAQPTQQATTTTSTPAKTTEKATTTTTSTPAETTQTSTTTQRPPEENSQSSKPKKSIKTEVSNPLMEDIEEITTPKLPELPDKPLAGEFPQEPPPLFPFPGLFPPPFPKPTMPTLPTAGPSFEICSNPWNFQDQIGDTHIQRLERQLARVQCELALHQRSQAQLANTVERELTDLKKLVFGMVSRMSRFESILRSAAFG